MDSGEPLGEGDYFPEERSRGVVVKDGTPGRFEGLERRDSRPFDRVDIADVVNLDFDTRGAKLRVFFLLCNRGGFRDP